MRAGLAAASILILVGTVYAAAAQTAKHPEVHTILKPQEIKWSPASPAIPKGAEAAVLSGDPSKEGPFVLRLKFPGNYKIAPHTHPVTEAVTVISGTFNIGSGEIADKGKTQTLPAGSFYSYSPGMAHYAYTEEETVIQLSTVGPWALTYVNPKDDPRQKTQ
ncbi:MAG TPA: cupin domain-containing protein [Skermanella sp.]|jgi:quercetin dioxygenase-like cupin family protein|nr:cupin domain-containing protein [Skermanella sp.]